MKTRPNSSRKIKMARYPNRPRSFMYSGRFWIRPGAARSLGPITAFDTLLLSHQNLRSISAQIPPTLLIVRNKFGLLSWPTHHFFPLVCGHIIPNRSTFQGTAPSCSPSSSSGESLIFICRCMPTFLSLGAREAEAARNRI
jgi:hypothetical protein